MGIDQANGDLRGHGKGTDPISGDLELVAHWEDENIDEASVVTTEQGLDLIVAADTSQAAFDAEADGIVSWYGFLTLSTANRAKMRAAMRKGVDLIGALTR